MQTPEVRTRKRTVPLAGLVTSVRVATTVSRQVFALLATIVKKVRALQLYRPQQVNMLLWALLRPSVVLQVLTSLLLDKPHAYLVPQEGFVLTLE